MKITTNRKAYFEYSVLEDFNAGIMLLGAEVKSIRNGDVNITDCFIYIKNGELWTKNLKIARYKQTMNIISKCDDEETKKFFDGLMEISNYIKSYFDSQNIQTVEDIKMVYHKLKSIRSFILDDEFKLLNYRGIISEIFYPSDVKRACERLKEKRENDGRVINDELEDYKRLKNIEKYIKSILV